MSEGHIQQPTTDFEKIKDQLKDTQAYLHEVRLHQCFSALLFASLAAVVVLTWSYLLYGPITTDWDKTLYMFSLLIGPSAFFLLLLHLYELYGFVKKGEKSIPLTLDLTYFIYVVVSFATMMGLTFYFQQHTLSQKFLTTGWTIGVILLCGQVLLSLVCATSLVRLFISKKLPHFFEHPQNQRRKRPRSLPRQVSMPPFKPKQVYYFREKPDIALWQNEEYFIRYK